MRVDYFLTTLKQWVAVTPFRLKVFNQRHLQLRPTPIDLDIRDFHPYFIILQKNISKSRHGDSRWTFTLD